MKKLFRHPLPGIDPNIQKLFNEIVEASQSGDITDIGGSYTLTLPVGFTPTRTLNVSTATATDVAKVLATLILDLKAGGANRTT